jgi:hypothetical protein
MDPEVPRELGDMEDAEPEKRETRGGPPKKSLPEFLAEFEARLRDHPGESATSAPAALEGRAEGVWRTPVEGGERQARRLSRKPGWQRRLMYPPVTAGSPAPPAEPPDDPFGPAGETLVAPPAEPPAEPPVEPEAVVVEALAPQVVKPDVAVEPEVLPAVEPAVGAEQSEAAAERRKRHRQRRRRRHR